MKIDIPKISKMDDLKKEALELEKIQNTLNLNAQPSDHLKTVNNLDNIKNYYTEIGDFILSEQELEYLQELEKFFQFWEQVMNDFEDVKKHEIAKAIRKNKDVSNEMREILEKTTGFEAPPDSEYLQILAIRKIAFKLKTNDAVKYLNFDYFKKKNKKMNQDWVLQRKLMLERRIKKFEELLDKNTVLVKRKLNDELEKLHGKRLKQLNMLNIKFNKCRMLIDNINSQEMTEQKFNKKFFLLRNDMPQVKYSELDQFQEMDLLADKKNTSTFNPSVNIKEKEQNLDNETMSQRTVTKKMTHKSKQ